MVASSPVKLIELRSLLSLNLYFYHTRPIPPISAHYYYYYITITSISDLQPSTSIANQLPGQSVSIDIRTI